VFDGGFALSNTPVTYNGMCLLFLGIGGCYIGSKQKVVNAGIVKICQQMKNTKRNIQVSQLIVGICGLVDLQFD